MMDTLGCLICERIKLIEYGKNACFVSELSTGYIVFGDHQFYKGYTLFLSKNHVNELHELDPSTNLQFLKEMSIVAEAVHKLFRPRKLNYELLGNKDSHLHWHLFPRYLDDPDINRPVWAYPKQKRCNQSTEISDTFIKTYKPLLKKQVETILKTKGG